MIAFASLTTNSLTNVDSFIVDIQSSTPSNISGDINTKLTFPYFTLGISSVEVMYKDGIRIELRYDTCSRIMAIRGLITIT